MHDSKEPHEKDRRLIFWYRRGKAVRPQASSKIGCSALPGGSKTAFFEIFSPARLSEHADDFGMVMPDLGASFDILEGWDVRSTRDRKSFWERFRTDDPYFCLIEPDCKAFSQLM